MFISVEELYLSSSPDGIFISPTIGTGTIENQVPFQLRCITERQGIEHPNSPLQFSEENQQYYMNKGHDYYYQVKLWLCTTKYYINFLYSSLYNSTILQVQLQMYTTGFRFVFFVLYKTIESRKRFSSIRHRFHGGFCNPEGQRVFPQHYHAFKL
jgi:hypothetical protein